MIATDKVHAEDVAADLASHREFDAPAHEPHRGAPVWSNRDHRDRTVADGSLLRAACSLERIHYRPV